MLQLVSERTKPHGLAARRASRTRSATTSRRSRSGGACGPTRCSTTRRSRATRPTTSRASRGWGRRRRRSSSQTWGTLDDLYEHLDEVMPEKLRAPLTEYRDQVHREPRADAARARRGHRARPRRAGGWGSTTARPSSGCSASTSSGRSSTGCRRSSGERPEDAIAAMRELREAGFPAAQGVGSRGGSGPGGPNARGGRGGYSGPSYGSSGELQLSLDFDQDRRRAGGVAGRRQAARRRTAMAEAPHPPRRAPDGVAVMAGRPAGRARGGDRRPVAGSRWWTRTASRASSRGCAPRPSVGIGLVVDDPRPLAGTPLALAVAGDGRASRRGRWPGRVDRPAPPARGGRRPARRARGQAAPHRALRRGRRRDPARRRVRHPDRRVPRQRRAAGPEDRRRRRGAPRPRAAADRRRLPADGGRGARRPLRARGPSPRSSRRSRRTASSGSSPRSSCR